MFMWEKFVDEPRGAVEQVIIFVEQIAFWEALVEGGLDIDNAIHVHTMDVDLRIDGDDQLKGVTIDLE